jgi:hypothetical protein
MPVTIVMFPEEKLAGYHGVVSTNLILLNVEE